MLGKLIRHEFKATWKILLLLNAVTLGAGVACFFVMNTLHGYMENGDELISNNVLRMLVTSSYVTWFILYFLSIFAVNLGTVLFLMIRYYRSLYSKEGYLTFTLPVGTQEILHAKLITGYVWSIGGGLITMLSILLMLLGLLFSFTPFEQQEILQEVGDFANLILNPATLLLFVLFGLVMPLYGLISIYFCITVGQLWQKHKIAGAILCYIALNFVNRVIMSFLTIGRMMLLPFAFSDDLSDFRFSSYYNGTLITTLLFSVISCAVFYFVIRYINANKVNLD
ncbi:MAG: hypothetical protein K6G16_05720 [Lachnospiraceae bacterium]|nr:hypothetical protein [Lachnospiraceae bacterium]